MIQAPPRSNWIRIPSLCQPLLETLLRAAAMLVVHVVSFLGTLRIRLSGECHTEVTPAGLPRTHRDPIRKPGLAAADSEPLESLLSNALVEATVITPASDTLAHQGQCHPQARSAVRETSRPLFVVVVVVVRLRA